MSIVKRIAAALGPNPVRRNKNPEALRAELGKITNERKGLETLYLIDPPIGGTDSYFEKRMK